MKPGRMPGGFNMNALMKQAQKMQEDMKKLQDELAVREFTASAGGGAVKATVCDPDDSEMLCDLVMAAVNEAMNQCEEATAKEMEKITGGVQGLPF